MLLRSRTKTTWQERVRLAVWPRRSWRRSITYYWRRILRLTESPHSVAAGVASGIAAATTPFLGAHMVLSAVFAFLLRGNVFAALIATNFGNPLTYPVLWTITYEVGRLLMPMAWRVAAGVGTGQAHPFKALMAHGALLHHPWSTLRPIVEPMVFGMVPVALVLSATAYFLTRYGVSSYRRRRLTRLKANAWARTAGSAAVRAPAPQE